jgi:uncharacterized peroxidase-related enzyme
MFLKTPPADAATAALYQSDMEEDGYVMNLTRLWAWRPDVARAFLDLRKVLMGSSSLSSRERAVIVCGAVSTLGDSYCALAWGKRLADASSAAMAASVLRSGDPPELSAREGALLSWSREVVRSPNATKATDVERLLSAGLSEREIFEATALIAFRVAFSTVNDALGANPDSRLAQGAPEEVRAAVSYGRAVAETQSA